MFITVAKGSTSSSKCKSFSLETMSGRGKQCDQIGRFMGLYAIFKAFGNN